MRVQPTARTSSTLTVDAIATPLSDGDDGGRRR